MGLFSFNDRPGPGIDKNAPRRKGIFLFIEIFCRKFFKLLKANLLYFLVSLPFAALIYLFMPVHIFTAPVEALGTYSETQLTMFSLLMRNFLTMTFLIFIGSGPASAGFAYILKCFTREDPVWLFSDFFEKFKQNFKQSLITCIIGTLLAALMFIAVYLYFNMYSATQNMAFLLLGYIIVICMVTFLLMHTFIYQLMITYECNMITLYKNALLITFAKFPLVLIISAASVFVSYFISFTFHPLVALVLYILIMYGALRFPLEFYAARTIERLIKSNTKSEPEESYNDDEDDDKEEI